MQVVDAINELKQYPVEIVSKDGSRDEIITGVSAVSGMDNEAVINTIAAADAMATAVGVNIMPKIVPLIAASLKKRWADGNLEPFNIVICENLIDADKLMRKLICETLTEEEIAIFDKTTGLVEASIGRMVPVMTDEMRKGDILRVCVEEYCQLPVDRAAWKGEYPDIPGLHPYTPFEFYIRRKLYLHNMGHALTAYIGKLNDKEYIWQSIEDPYVKITVQRAMTESALAICRHFDYPLEKLSEHIEDLLLRFGNRALGDTVARVGRDAKRKLSSSDRFAGALKLAENEDCGCVYIALGAAAGMFFTIENDEGSEYIQAMIKEGGVDNVIVNHMELDKNSAAAGYIRIYYDMLKSGATTAELLAKAEQLKREVLRPKLIP
jgi:mannitol-1-phosphate 5-dehydrogenase